MRILLLVSAILFTVGGKSQSNNDLVQIIYDQDSLLFSVGFNTCNLVPFYDLVSEDCEFYHDQSGFTNSKEAFIAQIENGLCKLDYKATRELIAGSMRVFPMRSNGQLYGAIQEGKHRFYATYPGKNPVITSEASFTHLWILEEDSWHLKRVLSFDHHAPK